MDQTDTQAAPDAAVIEPQANTPAEPISQPATPVAADAKENSQPTSSVAGDQDANKKPTSLLDAVKRAVQTPADADSSTVETNGASASSSKSPSPGLDDPAKDKTRAEADQKLPFHNHPRWKEVVSERDAYRSDAGEYRKITSFMSSNGLTNAEVVEGFQIMALMKTNPAEAHKKISEYKARLDAYVGESLPEDIKKRVDEGYIDDASAKELAALKAEKQLQVERMQYAAEQQAHQARASIHGAVVSWEQQMKAKDPDWSAKQELVTDQAKLMLASERPSTPEEAIALVERAHSIIKERLSRFAPQRRPVSSVSSSASSANASPVPKSLLEAVRLGMTQSR
jgi:hypothetical protein